MSLEVIKSAISKGAWLYGNISGGKDGQAMVKVLHDRLMPPVGLIHADLGRIEWAESLEMCRLLSSQFNIPLHIITRTDGRDMIDHWKDRLNKLAGSDKPFWSSSANRYCTSDLKRDPINKFLRNCGHDFIISAEGVRAEESPARAKKSPLEIRDKITSSCYDGMTAEEAIEAYQPGKRLALTWYPIFNFTLQQVWNTYEMLDRDLIRAREQYKAAGKVPAWWRFHPAYVYGNDRVSCSFCILGSKNDLQVAARHRPEILQELIEMEDKGKSTFKNNWSLRSLLPI